MSIIVHGGMTVRRLKNLEATPHPAPMALARPSADRNTPDPEYIGFLELVSEGWAEGWVYAVHAPHLRLAVEFLHDDTVIGVAIADRMREDLLDAGVGDGAYGVRAPLPAYLDDGGIYLISARVEGGDFVLRGSPQIYRRDLPEPPLEPTDLGEDRARADAAESLPCATLLGNIDSITADGVRGWVYDTDTPQASVVLDMMIDGVIVSQVPADQNRPDVKAAGIPAEFCGFTCALPNELLDGKDHELEFRCAFADPRSITGLSGEVGLSQWFNIDPVVYVGNLDGLHCGAIRGWVVRHDRATGEKSGGVSVLISSEGHPIAELSANNFRPDVAEAIGCDPNCGFLFTPPHDAVAGRTMEIRVRIIPGHIEIANSPAFMSFPDQILVEQIRSLTEVADHIFTQLWDLRDRLKRLMPLDGLSVVDYDSWARRYYRLLSKRPPAPIMDRLDFDMLPLVSIICPVYRPRLKDFTAAVESVLAQTYPNWELIIVDDASSVPELSDLIARFAQQDARIKALRLNKNGGISAATNAALRMATGAYVAFFDHDDMMVDRAMEFMVDAAVSTGALMVYCDEDKIDDAGVYSEVNLKPDWNYRLLLSQNYICHILFVERAHLLKAGALRKECDGAQDHDLILRLAEITDPARIHHVPEVLYHWRKTPSSTAASGKSKSYTVSAGIRALRDHLARKGVAADVSSPLGITCYEVRYHVAVEPKVTIIIPYREHIGMTRECVEAIRSSTFYDNYEIFLVDNWSTSDEALAFAAEMNALQGVRVLRVTEAFNYSRLNNLAVAASTGEFLLFMNNDVFVNDPNWLREMVGEATADPFVAVVGAKLLYPNGRVQHGGVVLGVGGIADHANRGLAAYEPGYQARAICAQEYSAVTAACMLCRRAAFDEVGGFDEAHLRVAFNDVDLCLKIGAAGYRIVWTPSVVAEHRESYSRGNDFRPDQQVRFFDEHQFMTVKWRDVLARDRHYHPWFSRQMGIFETLRAPDSREA